MGTLIITIRRADTTKPWIVGPPWVTGVKSKIFSFEETLVLNNAAQAIEYLPGFLSMNPEVISDNELKLTLMFETLEDAEAAIDLIKNPVSGSILDQRLTILRAKRQEYSAQYEIIFTAI
jgi:hypothetical protein